MRKGEQTRGRLVETATRLIESQGYAATGLKQILAESDAPRGSFYFHFPGGKEDLAQAVVQRHRDQFSQALAGVLAAAPNTLAAARMVVEALALRMRTTACAGGCPVTTIALEMANLSDALRTSTRAAFDDWTARFAASLVADGHSQPQAQAKAQVLVCALEGALILCRTYGDTSPLDTLGAQLETLLAP